MTEQYSRYDTADYLKTDEDIALYFDACINKDPVDGSLVRAALSDIARSRGTSQLAKDVRRVYFSQAIAPLSYR